MSTEVDRLVVVFDANFQALDDKLNKVLQKQEQAKKKLEDTWNDTTLGAGLQDAISRLSSEANELPVIGAAMEALGPAGIVAAVGIGLVVGALEALEKAAAFGDEIFKSAAKVGASTEALQEWRHVVIQAGGDAKDADGAILGFTTQLGQAALGMPRALRAFQSLKLDPKAMIGDTDKALETVVDRLGAISSVAERVGLAKKLGLDAMIPVLTMTADQIEAAKKQAQDLGLVLSDETAVAAHELTDHFDELKEKVKNDLTTALVNLGPVLLPVIDWFADVASAVAKFAGNISEAITFMRGLIAVFGDFLKDSGIQAFGDKIAGILNDLNKAATGAPRIFDPNKIQAFGHNVMDRGRSIEAADKEAKEKAEADAKALRDAQNKARGAFDPGSLAKPKPAATIKDQTSEFDKAAQDALQASTKELATAQAALATTIEARAKFETDAVEAERKKKQADLTAEEGKIQKAINDKKSHILDTNSAKQLEELKQASILVDQTAAAQTALIARQKEADLLVARLDHEQALAALDAGALTAQKDHLTAQAALATTAAERNKLEQQALADQQRADALLVANTLDRAKKELDAAAAIDPLSEDTKKRQDAYNAALQAANNLPGKHKDEKAALDLSQEGPVQKYQRSVQDLNTTMSEAGVQAAKALSDGLADAIVNAKSLGDVASSVFRNLIQQILSAEIQKNIAAPILGALNLPAHAAGTLSSAAGMALVGERGPELVRLPGGSQVIPNSALRNVGLRNGSATQGTVITFDNRGAVIWEQAAKQMMSYADRAAAQASAGAVQLARRATSSDLSTQASRRLG